jgi:regulator of sigma E protease
MLLSLVAFLVILGVLVFVHELGHFMVAKWVGMRVDEFALGFPPRIYGKKIGETNYCLNAIPFGGYVKIHGEHPDDEKEDPRAFGAKSIPARIAVMAAGVVMNLLLAFVLLVIAFSVGFSSVGQNLEQVRGAKITRAEVYVGDVLKGSGADKAGIKPGDSLAGVTAQGTATTITSVEQLQSITSSLQHDGMLSLEVTYKHLGDLHTVPATLAASGPPLGVAIQVVNTVRVPFYRAPIVALREMKLILGITWDALANFAGRLVKHGQLDPNVTGPVGIYKATATATHEGFSALIFLTIALSLNLALLNILPIPALDGGKLFFLIIELIARKRIVSEKIEGIVSLIGFSSLIILIVILSVRDLIH